MPLLAYLVLTGLPGLALRAGVLDDDPTEVDLQMLTSIDYQEGTPPPRKVTKLDGKKVRVSGFMGPNTQEGCSEFQLVTDSCGCDGQPLVHHFILVNLGDDVTGYRPEMVTVTGVLSVGEEREDGYVVSLYRMKLESME